MKQLFTKISRSRLDPLTRRKLRQDEIREQIAAKLEPLIAAQMAEYQALSGISEQSAIWQKLISQGATPAQAFSALLLAYQNVRGQKWPMKS